jgi:hypothetical protein
VGHHGSVVRAGWYGRAGQRRQRWLCRPEEGESHRFAEVLPRIVASASGQVCSDCATQLEPWEGQPAPRLYGFAARDVAHALMLVAGGASYRATAAAVRTAAGRELSTVSTRTAKGRRRAPANAHAGLVSDWVEVFAPLIWAVHAPAEWPRRLVLDSAEFRHGSPGKARGEAAFSVLAAMGYHRDGRSYVAAIEAVPSATQAAWRAFLASLTGRPDWVVTDGGPELAGVTDAVADRVPQPTGPPDPDFPDADPAELAPIEVRRCEWHLARNLTDTLPDQVSRVHTDPIHTLIAQAQSSLAGWRRLERELRARQRDTGIYGPILTRLAGIDDLVRAQIATRAPTGPNTTGALEEFFHQLDHTIGDRGANLTNKVRTDALLKLIAARRNGWINEAHWAEVIRDHLTRHHGHAPPQRQHTDPKGAPSLR